MFFFPGDCSGRGAEVATKLGADSLLVEVSPGERINLWHIPAKGKSRGIVYFLHGNAQSNCSHVPPLGWLPESGYDLYALDYRGYGLSEGDASFNGAVNDVQTGFRFVAERAAKENLPVAVLGQSIGGSLAVKALSDVEPKPKLFILDSSFSGCARIVRDKLWFLPLINYPISQLFSCGSDPREVVSKLSPSKVLFLHCSADRTIGVDHSARLFSAAQSPKQLRVVEDCDHIQALSQQRIRNELIAELNRSLNQRDIGGGQCSPGQISTLTDPGCPVSWALLHRGRTEADQAGNTEKLIREAIRTKVPAIEIDLRLSRDRELVLYHNKRLTDDVVSGPRGLLGKQIEDISALEAQSFKYKGTTEGITLFREVAREIALGNTVVFLDIKGRFDRIVRAAVRQASRFKAKNRLVIQCDNVEQLKLVQKEFPEVATLFRIHGAEDLLLIEQQPPDIIQVDEPLIEAAVELKTRLPIRVLAKNFEPGVTPESSQALFDRGVDLVMTEGGS